MGFDVDRCIELHNRIVAHARSHLPNHQPKIQRSWFTAHSLDPSSPGLGFETDDERFEFELDDELTAFLSAIDIVVPEEHQHLAFNPLLVGIPPPSRLIPDMWLGTLEEHEDNYILLYMGTGYDPGGLVYSYSTQQVCYLDTPYLEPSDRYWDDLQNVLEFYWNCVESGKFVIDVECPGFGERDNLTTQGWRIEEWTGLELEGALEAWHSLVDTITKRLPGIEGTEDDGESQQNGKEEEADTCLIPSEILEQYPAIPPFARAFLSRAKKPIFTSIAPQLDVPNEAFIHRIGAKLQELYPNASLTTRQHEIDYLPNFLLFPWRTRGLQFVFQSDHDRWQNKPGRTYTLDNRAGLYLTPDGTHAHSISLILPFPLGAHGHVRKNDGTTVERECQGQSVLYQHGMCFPFLYAHGTPLAAVLANWWELVENEVWHVDEDGVVGGADIWKEADTEENAEDYQTNWSCF
jgi:hypothetical protein